MPERYKRAFEVWVDDLVPPLGLWKPDDLYAWANKHGYAITALTCAAASVLWGVIFMRFKDSFHTHPSLCQCVIVIVGISFTIGVLIFNFMWWIIGYFSLEYAIKDVLPLIDLNKWRRHLFIACSLICIALVMYVLGYRDYLEKGLFIFLYVLVMFGVPLIMGALFVYFVTFLRLPAKWLLRMVQWLAYHPKGAWAALLLALTSALDLLRVIFR